MPPIPQMGDDGALGLEMLELAGHTEEESAVEPAAEPPPAFATPVAPEAPGAAATEEPAAAPILEEPDYFQLADDGSVTVNGRTYPSSDEAFKALYHAQRHIDTTRNAPPAPPLEPEEDDDGDDEPSSMLLSPGAPIGGEPETLDELYAWAAAQPAQAAQWALANQDVVPPDAIQGVYAHWVQNDPAGAHNYNLQLQMAATEQRIAEAERRMEERLAPYAATQRTNEVRGVLENVRKLPLIEHYEPRMRLEIESMGPEYVAWLEQQPSGEQYDELFTFYSRLRVQDAIAGTTPAEGTPAAAAPGGAPAAGGARPAGAPVTEKRGARGPARVADDDLGELVTSSVEAFQNPFGLR